MFFLSVFFFCFSIFLLFGIFHFDHFLVQFSKKYVFLSRSFSFIFFTFRPFFHHFLLSSVSTSPSQFDPFFSLSPFSFGFFFQKKSFFSHFLCSHVSFFTLLLSFPSFFLYFFSPFFSIPFFSYLLFFVSSFTFIFRKICFHSLSLS